jgi:transposase
MSVRKGHNHTCVFCDLLGKRVLFAVKGRDKKVWEAFVQATGAHNSRPRAIREVSMYMRAAYIAGLEENIGSQAVMIFDKYHVIAHVNDAVNTVCTAEIQVGDGRRGTRLEGADGYGSKIQKISRTNRGPCSKESTPRI